jgi:hypothetical protein
MRRLLSLTLACILTVAALAAFQAVTIKRKPSTGEVHKYRTTIIFTLYGNDVVYKSTVTDTVVDSDKDSYSVRTVQTDVSAMNADREMPIDSKSASASTAVYDLLGQVKELKGDTSPEAWRLANLGAVHLPPKAVAPSETWTADIPANTERGIFAATATCKLVGPEKVDDKDAIVVQESFKETAPSNPASAENKIWLDPATGSVIRMEGEWHNAPLLGTPTLINAHVTYELIP